MIDWNSNESIVLQNPKSTEKVELGKGLIWVATSGSQARKWVGLSRTAILASAEAVNAHFSINANDHWVHPLPDFHVGGLGIWARSYLSGASVEKVKWDPLNFPEGTLTALVPTMLWDLVQNGIRAPKNYRIVLVGGGYFSKELYKQAVALGWPVVPTYGMSESASQVATALPGDPRLRILPHMEVKVDETLNIKSPALLSLYAIDGEYIDPKVDGWLSTNDRAILEGEFLTPLGRVDSIIKIGGESVDLLDLQKRLEKFMQKINFEGQARLVGTKDHRLGQVITLEGTGNLAQLADTFNAEVLPFERVRVHFQMVATPPSNA